MENRRYKYVRLSEQEYDHYSLFLDTNVVINMEKFYYQPHKLSKKLRYEIVDILYENRNKEWIPGFGIYEACFDINTKRINNEMLKKMEYAITSLQNMTPLEISMLANSHGIISNISTQRNKTNEPDTLIELWDANPFLFSTYASLLKLFQLKKKKSKGRELENFKSYVKFMTDDIGTINALELIIGAYYFLSTGKKHDCIQSLIKINNSNILQSVWNASWDIFFYRVLYSSINSKELIGSILNNISEVVNPKLLTGDNALIEFCKSFTLTGTYNSMSVLFVDDRDIKKEFLEELYNINRTITSNISVRMEKLQSIKDPKEHLTAIISKIEKELTD